MKRDFLQRWLPFSVLTGAALTLWALAAIRGYGWAMIWLPAVVAGVAWPRERNPANGRQCRRRVAERHRERSQPLPSARRSNLQRAIRGIGRS